MIDDETKKAFAAEIDEVIATHEKNAHQQGRTVVGDVAVDSDFLTGDERRVDQKSGLITRHPTLEEIDQLMKAETDRGGRVVDLRTVPSWVVEENGVIVGCLVARPVFEVHSFPVASAEGIPTIPGGRAELLLLEACHRWLRSAKNGVGAHYAFSISPDESSDAQLARLGWKQIELGEQSVFARTF
jgi:hypothetical protein